MEQIQAEKVENLIDSFYKNDSQMRYDKWNYEDGCILLAAIQLYKATNRELFREFVLHYVDQYVMPDGTIAHYKQEDYKLDDVAPGRAILFAYDQTGRERYRKAADQLFHQLENQPRTKAGCYWHKKIYPNQVWLDGLFMSHPFYVAYSTRYNREYNSDITKQFRLVRDTMFSEEKKLYFHGYDESRSMFWANKESGCSANFWLRAMAWFLMGLTDTLEEMGLSDVSDSHPLAFLYKESIDGILPYRDKSGLFYQLIDLPDLDGNYLESSGSSMIAASVLKACRLGILPADTYQPIGEQILEGVIQNKVKGENPPILTDNCAVAGLGPEPGRRDGSIAYYLSEPIVENDKKGMAALFMAYAQYLLVSLLH